jgi:NDP-sugar pyrophosphorylase family protein
VVDADSYLALHHQTLLAFQQERLNPDGPLAGLSEHVRGVWAADDAHIDSQARIYGPVLIGPGARIEGHAVIIGPSTIGAGAVVGLRAVVAESAVWSGVRVAAETILHGAIAPGRNDGRAQSANGTKRSRARGFRSFGDGPVAM